MKLRSTNGENKARLGSRSLGTLFQFFEGFTEWASWCETIDAMGQLHCLLAGTESDQQLEKLILYGNPELIVFRLQINKYQNSIVLFGPHYCRVHLQGKGDSERNDLPQRKQDQISLENDTRLS